MTAMQGLWLEGGALRVRGDLPVPEPEPGEALVRVRVAGVCGTDLALADGLYPFTGVPGHEFVGVVVEGPQAVRGRRVAAEINAACGRCGYCRSGLGKHCPERTAIGIRGRDGAFAEYVCVPAENLHLLPDGVSTEAAVFTEPLAAALDVLEQVGVEPRRRVLVVGAGRLGQLVCRVLAGACAELVAVGRHPRKLERLRGIVDATTGPQQVEPAAYDLAVECTGNAAGLAVALGGLRARGTLVLKSTHGAPAPLDATRVVVDELRILGSRCGPFVRAIEFLERGDLDAAQLVDARYPLARAAQALERSRAPGILKVLLEMP